MLAITVNYNQNCLFDEFINFAPPKDLVENRTPYIIPV